MKMHHLAPWMIGLLLLWQSPRLAAEYRYTLRWLEPQAHTYAITLEVKAGEDAPHTDFQMAVWRPGRYIRQDFAAAVSRFAATDGSGKNLKWEKINPHTWRVYHSGASLRIVYQAYANNPDAGSSYVGEGQAYFNPANIFMYVPGRLNEAVQLELPDMPNTWKSATALAKGAAHNQLSAADWHEFADSPTVLAAQIKQLSFEDRGVKFFLHFHGEFMGDKSVEDALLRDIRKICSAQAAIFGGYPFKTYHFIYRLLPFDLRHAVEHSNSASFALPAGVTRSTSAAQNGMYGITAHEFWHVWNVKRIRPQALWEFDYSEPPITGLHWFTEGVTEYYTDLSLLRAGLIGTESFLERMAEAIEGVENNYAASQISPSVSSVDSWLSTSNYKHPMLQVSYYTLGQRIGLLLDLSLRKESGGKVSLDDVFRYLNAKYYERGMGVPENGVQLAAESLTGKSWQRFFDDYIHNTSPFDYAELFRAFGLSVTQEENENTPERRIGLLQLRPESQGLVVGIIRPGSDAWQAGLGAGDLILGVKGEKVTLNALRSACRELSKNKSLQLSVISDMQAKDIEITFRGGKGAMSWQLKEAEKAREEQQALRQNWYSGGLP